MNGILNVAIKAIAVIFVLSYVTVGNNINAQTKLTADVYASYFGGSGYEGFIYLAVDPDGNVIIAGHTYSSDLPIKNAFQSNFRGGNPRADAFVAKFSSDLSMLIFSTFLGGSDYDEIRDVVIDKKGNIYVTGLTESSDFPVTSDAIYETFGGGSYDAFLTKLSPDGQLLYSTYFGGNQQECGYGIAVIDSSTVSLAGTTNSTNFPLQSPLYNSIKGGREIFLLKLDIANDTLLFSTYIGGNGEDVLNDIEIDASFDIYICGSTQSNDFPFKNAVDSVYGGNVDGFISKINKEGNELMYSSFIGGSGEDALCGISINYNEIYFIGKTTSTGFNCTGNAFQTAKSMGTNRDMIIGKLNAAGNSFLYLSYFFGTDNNDYDANAKIKFIGNESVVIAGRTNLISYPITNNAYDTSISDLEMYVSVLDIGQKEILYSTFLGGTDTETGFSLSALNDSTVAISGMTKSANFPFSSTAVQKANKGDWDAFFARFKFHSIVTGINENQKILPTELKLIQNYPNPFNPTTKITYAIPNVGTSFMKSVKLKIYDVLGREITTLVDGMQSPGMHTIEWNATGFPSGVYFYQLQADMFNEMKKLVLLK